MRKIFCPGCGKDIPRSQEFCFECRPRDDLLFKETSIKFCLNCDKINPLNNWGRFDTFEIALENAVRKSIKSKNYEITEIIIPEIERKPGLNLEAQVKIVYDEQEFIIPVGILVTTCPMCSTINDTYIEGILQLRNCNQKVIDYVWEYVENNKDKGVNINQQNEVRGGHDFVFNNKQHMRRLALALKKKFPYTEYKEAAQHFSQDHMTGKVIYRLNILYRQGKEDIKKDEDSEEIKSEEKEVNPLE